MRDGLGTSAAGFALKKSEKTSFSAPTPVLDLIQVGSYFPTILGAGDAWSLSRRGYRWRSVPGSAGRGLRCRGRWPARSAPTSPCAQRRLLACLSENTAGWSSWIWTLFQRIIPFASGEEARWAMSHALILSQWPRDVRVIECTPVPEEGSSGRLPKSLLRYVKAGVSIFLSNLNCLKKSHHDKHNKLFYYKK